MKTKPIRVTGATGYVGGRLAPRLLEAGYRVRALGRSVAKLRGRPWGSHPNLEVAKGDVLDEESLQQAAKGAAWPTGTPWNPFTGASTRGCSGPSPRQPAKTSLPGRNGWDAKARCGEGRDLVPDSTLPSYDFPFRNTLPVVKTFI